ncbi:MAG: MBL fold metallo-hydrolase [Deltaproteobacteria bacterium]|nr:MBL fold metallo-hydrolase [Deltaproteobacteria bacterium]
MKSEQGKEFGGHEIPRIRRPVCRQRLLLLFIFWGLGTVAPAYGASCTGQGLEVQVLGSGGPEIQDKRASSAYLVWVDGRARVLIDAGSGSANHFGDAGAQVEDLDIIFLTHLHVDHAADLPVLVKSSFFGNRTRPLPVLGPAGNNLYPATTEFVRLLFDRRSGAYRYLGDYLTGENGAYALQVKDLPLPEDRPTRVFDAGGITAYALPSGHGPVPSLAHRLEIGGLVLAFSGDTSGNNKALVDLAREADIFIAHNAVPEEEEGVGRALHMPPSVIGKIAGEARVKKLVLAHFMNRTLGREKETVSLIRKNYGGPIVMANDLDCYPVKK